MVELGKRDSEKNLEVKHPHFTDEKTDFPRVTLAAQYHTARRDGINVCPDS